MSPELTILLTAGLVATACGLLGPFLVLRRVSLLGDAVSHAVLPGIVASFLLFHSRAPLLVILGAAVFAVVCVVAIDALKSSGLVASDAAIALVFPALFGLGVLGVHRYAANIHLDLDSTIYGEIAFAPFRTLEIAGFEIGRSIVIMGIISLANLALVGLLWKELKATSFDPLFSRVSGFSPRLVSRIVLVAVAITAVTAFESVGAILVIALLIVPASAAHLLTDRLLTMVGLSVVIGWASAGLGYWSAIQLDASIAGAMGVAATGIFAISLVLSPRYGLLAQRLRRRVAVPEIP